MEHLDNYMYSIWFMDVHLWNGTLLDVDAIWKAFKVSVLAQ